MDRRILPFLLCTFSAPLLLCVEEPRNAADTCLAFVSVNLARGGGNWYTYYRFSSARHEIKAGDALVYEVFLDPRNPVARGGIDLDFADGGSPLRDVEVKDSEGIRSHGDATLDKAIGRWHQRRISLDAAKGRVTSSWNFVFEGDKEGRYAQFVDNVAIEHAAGTRTVVYETGLPPARAMALNNGYTTKPSCSAVDRNDVQNGKPVEDVVAKVDRSAARVRQLEQVRMDIAFATEFAKRNPDMHLVQHLAEATAALDAVELNEAATAEEIQKALHAAKNALQHTHPAMTAYTGHLVGHAHIDLQWLWDWQEGIVVTHDTFAQAVKFMDEFPGFTFSQSSSCLYQAVEEHYPELFKKIQAKVKKGQWEIVGGRICEADTNMISHESHARHFLYGQRYFREKFGKTAVVGWEPDTFGHTAQMPQILKLGGCDYYYFCRAGKGKPLFWWQGLDGTRILTFEETATGSWYNSDLSYKQFQEMLDFEKAVGSKDMLWVYGVGNHGGGPTREYIQEALGWMKDKSKPKVRFSTATEFFKKLSTYDLTKIPVVAEDLNPVFEGCYTTHAEIKQLNRQAEAMTTSAEAAAAVAHFWGFKYPRASLRRNWEDICFNHHHDTLPGSGVHSPYERTKTQLNRVIADDKDIITRALESLTLRVTPKQGGMSVLVFNPLGWRRSGWVETYLVPSGWDAGAKFDASNAVAVAPNGKEHPVVLLDKASKLGRFWAADVPSFGYKVFQIRNGALEPGFVKANDELNTFETDRLIVAFDERKGSISRLYDKQLKREMVKQGGSIARLEEHFEKPQAMSAWSLGEIDRVEPAFVNDFSVDQHQSYTEVSIGYTLEEPTGPIRNMSYFVQTFRIEMGSPNIDAVVECNWKAVGSASQPNPMVRVAFDVGASNPVATYQVPFGRVSRPANGQEWPALQWADLSDKDGGVAIINDSKHGYSATGSTLRMSLIRSSYEPDPVPNPGRHTWRYSIVPHGMPAHPSLDRLAAEFNQPLFGATVPFEAKGDAPHSWSAFTVPDFNVVPTALKLAEDADDLVVRLYEANGIASEPTVSTGTGFSTVAVLNFLEDRIGGIESKIPYFNVKLRPFEIKTLRFGGSSMAYRQVVKKAIENAYSRWSEAYLSNDVPKMISMLAPDFTITGGNGSTRTREQYVVSLKTRQGKPREPGRLWSEIRELRISKRYADLAGAEAEVTILETHEKPATSGPATRTTHLYRDVWVKSNGRWLMKSTATLAHE